jgi:protein-disulfide isomerase
MSVKRAAVVTFVVALIGLAIAVNIAYLHSQLAGGAGYTSWCAINPEVNCDVVLASEYAYFLGVPIAAWAVLNYFGVAVAALIVLNTARASRRRQLVTALFVVAIWSVVFSLYLLGVSLFVLGALCLLCSGLYVVNLALLVSTALLYSAGRGAGRQQEAWQGRLRLIAGVAAAAVVVLVGIVGWKASQGEQILSADEIKQKDPEFYAWYTNLPTTPAELGGGHTKGQADALVTLTEFSDFECGHCANAYRSLKQILPRYQKDVQVRFHHFPLDPACNPAVKHALHQYACLAAMAAECAGAQGRFWEYHDLLFEHQSSLDRDSLVEYAQRAGLDRAAFLACLDSDAPRQAIARDVADGMRLGIESTPTFFLNGRTITGAPRADALGYAIQLERAAKQRGEG